MEDNKAEKNEEHFLEASVEFTLKEFKEENVEKASNSSFPDENSGSDFEKELWDHPSVRGHLFWHISFRENNQLSDKTSWFPNKGSSRVFESWVARKLGGRSGFYKMGDSCILGSGY